MATITMTKTISAAHLARTIPALKAKYKMPDTATNQQIQDEFEKECWANLTGIVKLYEQQTAAKAAADQVTDIILT